MSRRKVELKNSFRPRPVQFLQLLEFGSWRIKLYGLTAGHTRLLPELVRATKELVKTVVLSGTAARDTYEVGFAGIHCGVDANFIFIDWWENENELHHQVFVSSLQEPLAIKPAPQGVTACVFDLQVIWFERNAWVDKVLANPAGPDLDAYVEKRLSDDA